MEFVGKCDLLKDRVLSPDGIWMIWIHFRFIPWRAPFPALNNGARKKGRTARPIGFFGSFPSFLLLTCGSQREPFTRSIRITWEFRNANSSVPCFIFWIGNLGSRCGNVCYTKPFRWSQHMLMFGNHCPCLQFLYMFSSLFTITNTPVLAKTY